MEPLEFNLGSINFRENPGKYDPKQLPVSFNINVDKADRTWYFELKIVHNGEEGSFQAGEHYSMYSILGELLNEIEKEESKNIHMRK
jgi:hypothetical protein